MSSAKTYTTTKASTSQQQSPSLQPPLPKSYACCIQCQNQQSAFFCTVCLSERLILQHADYRRLREARQKGRSRVEALLGLVEIPKELEQQSLPDPFVEPEKRGNRRKYSSPITASHHGASVEDRMARATTSKLQSEMASHIETIRILRESTIKAKGRILERRQNLNRRKSLLEEANRYMLHGEDEGADEDVEVISIDKMEVLKAKVDELQAEGRQIASEVAKQRAKLAREAFSLFNVCAPSSSLASTRISSDRSKATPSGRSQRSKERYSTGGAFAIDFTSAFDLGRSFRENKAKEAVGNVNDWTILGLVLPLPSDVRRFDRTEINGAISHMVQLLQLVTTYLGITLPFVLSVQAELPQIRANPLWGAGTKETLHLSQSAHSAITAAGSTTSMGGMGASMMSNLGASTLSTLESFVQLPSGKNLPWSKNTPEATSSKGIAVGQTSRSTDRDNSQDAATLEGKRFCSALTMLSYDVAYLAHIQGIKIDLVMAAGSTLRLLSKAISSAELGKRSHAAHHLSSNISSLQFAAIDFAQLLQVHEPKSNATATITKEKHSSSKPIMEGSYVDAKKAAESILDITQKNVKAPSIAATPAPPSSISPTTINNTQTKEKMSSLAAKRIPTAIPMANPSIPTTTKTNLPPSTTPKNTLDFLRARGQREQSGDSKVVSKKTSQREADRKPQSATPDALLSTAPSGTIIFNGKEIRGKAKSSSKVDRSKPQEEGWNVL